MTPYRFLAAAIATTPPTTAQISIIVDEAGSPTQAVLPVVRDPIFGGPSPNQIPAIHPAQRVMANIHTLPGSHGFAPRPDRVAQMPTAANAQGLYPPDALIFVAKWVLKDLKFDKYALTSFLACLISALRTNSRRPVMRPSIATVETTSRLEETRTNTLSPSFNLRWAHYEITLARYLANYDIAR